MRHNRSFESYKGLGLTTALSWISCEAISWDLWTSGTMAFLGPDLAKRGGALEPEGHGGKNLQSRIRGGNHARRILSFYVVIYVFFGCSSVKVHRGGGNFGCILLQLKSTMEVAILIVHMTVCACLTCLMLALLFLSF